MTTLLTSAFPTLRGDMTVAIAHIKATSRMPALTGLPVDVVVDIEMCYVLYLLEDRRLQQAEVLIDSLVYNDDDNVVLPPLYASWLWLARCSMLIEEGNTLLALSSVENSLHQLAAHQGKMRDDGVALLACSLLYLARIHAASGDYGRAVKEVAKSMKLYERLAAKREDKPYGAALEAVVKETSAIMSGRARLMGQYSYYNDLAERSADDPNALTDALAHQGQIMQAVGNYRDAMRLYSRALRNRKHLNRGAMGTCELQLSIGLAAALIHITGRREAGERLLQSLPPLARQLNDADAIKALENMSTVGTRNNTIMILLKSLI